MSLLLIEIKEDENMRQIKTERTQSGKSSVVTVSKFTISSVDNNKSNLNAIKNGQHARKLEPKVDPTKVISFLLIY